MRLTRYTDYAMRSLIFIATRSERLSSISEIADAYGISKNHLMKVVNGLVGAGYLESVRGRNGGVRLARDPRDINLGDVVRFTEGGFDLVDCTACVISPACGFNGVLREAFDAFMGVLDRYSLHQLVRDRSQLMLLLPQMSDRSAA